MDYERRALESNRSAELAGERAERHSRSRPAEHAKKAAASKQTSRLSHHCQRAAGRRHALAALLFLIGVCAPSPFNKAPARTPGGLTCYAGQVPESARERDQASAEIKRPSRVEKELRQSSAQTGREPSERAEPQLARLKRQAEPGQTTKQRPDLTRIVAVSGQTIEFQCPLANELLVSAHANSRSSISGNGAPISRAAQEAQLQLQAGGRIIWRKDGQTLSQMNSTRLRLSQTQNSSSLTILQAQPRHDEASYECALLEGDTLTAGAKVHQFQLRLLVPPRLAPFEFPADAQVGMKVLLTCSALEGQQPISFVWLRDNQIIDSAGLSPAVSTAASGAGANSAADGPQSARQQLISTLGQLHRQQLADKFALSAHATINLGDKSEYVLIGARANPAAAATSAGRQASSTSDSAASRAEDEDELEDFVAPAGGKQAGADGKAKSTMHLADASIRIRQADDYSILSIEPLELKHAGRYTCSAQNEAARVSHSSQLIINAPPTLTVEPKDGDLVSGHSIVIDCAASGQPRPSLSWLRARETNNGKQWDFVPIYENLRYTILSNGSLAINNVTQREQGFYLCSAKNGFGPEVTKLIKITVHEPARISSKYKLVEARVDEQARLGCEAEGEPPLSLVWLDKEGKQIDKNDKRFIIDDSPHEPAPNKSLQTMNRGQSAAAGHQPNVGAVSSSLIIARASRPDSGHYTCQAINKHGQDKLVVNLLIQDVPDKVADLKVTNVTASTISLRWQLGFTGNAPVTSYLVQYQSDDPLDDLLMSVAKSNQANNGQPESAASTTPQSPSGTGSDLSPFGLYRHLFGFGDEKEQDKQQRQQQQASSIKAALETLNSLSSSLGDLSITTADEAIDRTLVELTVEQTATSLVIKDLSPFCVYRLRLAGINKIGLGEFSDWIRAKTEEAAPSGSALKIAAAATGPNSIKLTWLPPDRRTWNGQLAQFQIGYRPIDSTYEFNKSVEWTPPSLMQSIMFDVDGNTTNRRRLEAKQPARSAAQVAPAEPHKNGDTSGSANSTNKPPGGSSPYALRQHLRQLLAMQQQELVAHLTNLQRSTTYLVWIQAVNGRGTGPPSHSISVKTLDDVPPSAPALRVQSTSSSSITIAWSMLSNFVSPANQYSLFYRRVPPPTSSGHQSPTGSPFYPARQQSFPADDNATAPGQTGQTGPAAQGGGNSAAVFSEPGPFVEMTITSQQLLHTMNHQLAGPFLSLDGPEPKLLGAFQPQQMHHQHYQQFVYTLEPLECGSIYELYMTTRNSVGKSEPSAVVTTRTLGEPPLAPQNKNSLFTKIGAQDVLLNLASWSSGGCPLTHIGVRYKQLPQQQQLAISSLANASSASVAQSSGNPAKPSFSVAWPVSTSVPATLLETINQLQSQSGQARLFASAGFGPSAAHATQAHLISGLDHNQQAAASSQDAQQAVTQFALKNLQPSTSYELEIVVHNAAGHTTAQYEFVTAGPNGSRSGYTRREGVYRLDQRGQPVESGNDPQSAGPLSAFAADNQNNLHQTSAASSLQQLVPLILTLLCIVCLIVTSAFCYHRLTSTWKERASRRHSIDGMRSICSGSNGGHSTGNGNDGPHLAKSAGLQSWSRLNGGPASSRCFKGEQRRLHSELVDDHSPSSINTSDSPPADQNFHYCLRDSLRDSSQADSQQHLMSATLNPKGSSSFSQSVSMRDFNMIAPLAHQAPAATLNPKNARTMGPRVKMATGAGISATECAKLGATLARGRLLDEASIPMTEAYGNLPMTTNHRNCSNYGTNVCKQKQDQLYSRYHQQAALEGVYAQNNGSHPSCNYQMSLQEQAQSHETSWTTTQTASLPSGTPSDQHRQGNGTNYAIPATYQHQLDPSSGEHSSLPFPCDDVYGQGTIDACIQHLMGQQYQQQQPVDRQQQQQYALLMANQVPNEASEHPQSRHNSYGDSNGHFTELQLPANPEQTSGQQQFDQQQRMASFTAAAQSVIESTSSSSGIGVDSLAGLNHLDGVSSMASTTNLSNTNHQQQQYAQQQV